MDKHQSVSKRVSGVSHLKKEWRPVSIKFEKADGDMLERVARETGRSVTGFVRYAAMKYASEVVKGD